MGLLALMGLLGLMVAAVLTWSRGWPPIPAVHDEASFLLAADTFARGRLTNPTPPLWEHFETFHVLMQPSYAAKYPPAQGLMLALGQILTGEPIVGVWLSTGLFCVALTWMLLAWFPRRWALWGVLLTLLIIAGGGISQGYWLATFWGGTIAATGAALVYGAIRRITQSPSPLSAVIFALGLGILFLSRPFEGGLVALPALVLAVLWLLRDSHSTLRWRARRVLLPFALVVTAIGAFAGVYNARLTGSPWRLPYLEYEDQYSQVPIFLVPPRPTPNIEYRNTEMRRFYERQHEARREKAHSLRALARTELDRSAEIRHVLVPGLTLILVVAALTSRRRRSLLMPAAGSALVLGGAMGVTWFFPHYIAPLIAPWAIVLTAGAERLADLEPRPGKTGLLLTSFIFAVTAIATLLVPVRLREQQPKRRVSWYAQRDSLERSLEESGGKHLVLVSYGAKHNVHDEWVYNTASLNDTRVLWARSLTPQKDARLLDYYRERMAWRLQVDSSVGPFRLRAITDRSHAELARQ